MTTITPLSSILPIQSATSQGRHGRGQQFADQGQLLKALVVSVKDDAGFILDIEGNRLTVKSDAPLTVGQKLTLQVVKTSPRIELKIVTDTLNQFLGRSLTLIGKNIDISTLFKSFANFSPPPLSTVTPTTRETLENYFSLQNNASNNKKSGVILKQLIDNLGLSLEKLLAKGDTARAAKTLKAALMEISHNFNSAGKIADTTNNMLTTLELFQLAQLQTGGDRNFIFPLPLPFIDQGYLIVDNSDGSTKNNERKDDDNRFSLHLTMAELGHLHIDFLKNCEGLFIRFRTEDEKKADFVSQFADDLKDSISNVHLAQLTFSSDAPDPVNDLIRQLLPAGESMLTTKA